MAVIGVLAAISAVASAALVVLAYRTNHLRCACCSRAAVPQDQVPPQAAPSQDQSQTAATDKPLQPSTLAPASAAAAETRLDPVPSTTPPLSAESEVPPR
jgi:hypothetical protein